MADTKEKEITAEKKPSNKITIKQRIILLVSCPLIVILLSSIAIVITVRNIESGKIVEDTDEAKPDVILELPEAFTSDADSYLAGLLNTAAEKTDVKINSGVNISVHDVGGDLSEDVYKVIGNITGQVVDSAKAKYTSSSVNYGEACTMLKDLAPISSEEIEASGEGKNDSYSYTLNIPVDSAAIKTFTDEDRRIFEETVNECGTYMEIADSEFALDSIIANYWVNAEKEYITGFELVREYKVNAGVEFLQHLEPFGSGTITFGCRISTKYDIIHAGISVQEELNLNRKGFQTLSMSANVADDALSVEDAESEGITDPDRIFNVEFFSSDESIATVDKTGMVDAVKASDEPVIITVRLTYRGNVYEDTCTVHVTEAE